MMPFFIFVWNVPIFFLGSCTYVLWVLILALLGRACYGVLRFVMESGAKGCEVSVLVYAYFYEMLPFL
jgi:hypothetical protein